MSVLVLKGVGPERECTITVAKFFAMGDWYGDEHIDANSLLSTLVLGSRRYFPIGVERLVRFQWSETWVRPITVSNFLGRGDGCTTNI